MFRTKRFLGTSLAGNFPKKFPYKELPRKELSRETRKFLQGTAKNAFW